MHSSCIIILHLCFTVFALSNIEYTIDEKRINCITDLIKYINSENILVISNDTGIISKNLNAILSLSNMSLLTKELDRIDVYILTFHKTVEFVLWLKNIEKFKFWRPTSKFIISISQTENTTEIFEIAWKYYIININILLMNNNEYEVYTYYPFKNENCVINFKANLLFRCSEYISKNVFPEKVPKQFNGCSFRVMPCVVVPYVMNFSGNKDTAREVGFELVSVHTILTRLNATPTYLINNYSCWGDKLPNGSYIEQYGVLQRKEADLVVGAGLLEPGNTDFDTLCQGNADSLYWFVPTPDLINPWDNLQHVFSPYAWCLIIVSIIVNALIWWIFGRNTDNEVFNNLTSCIAASSLIFLQGGTKSPETEPLRILFASWLIITVIIYTAHQSQLVSALTKPQYEKQISTVEEMIKKLKFGFIPQGLSHYTHPTDTIDIKIRALHTICSVSVVCVNRSAFQRDFGVLKGSYPIKYFASQMYTFPDGRPMLYGINSGIFVSSRYVLNKGDPRIKRLNPILGLIFSNGLMGKWIKDVTEVNKFVVEPENTSLTIKHLAIGFLFLFIGYIISTIIFFIEIIRNLDKTKTN